VEGRVPGQQFIPAYNAVLFAAMQRTCRQFGYALAIHGSMHKDLDLLAVPWTDQAVAPAFLVDQLVTQHGLIPIHSSHPPTASDDDFGPSMKPHGRQSWMFSLGQHYLLDLAVMPTL
jgi:hypothetical protein